jgi:hypothetical protein
LGNLQLLEGHLNVLKSDCMPFEWLEQTYPDLDQRKGVVDRHDLGEAPRSAAEFLAFYKARRERIKKRLTMLLAFNQDPLLAPVSVGPKTAATA